MTGTTAVRVGPAREAVARCRRVADDLREVAARAADALAGTPVSSGAPRRLQAIATWTDHLGSTIDAFTDEVIRIDAATAVRLGDDWVVRIDPSLAPADLDAWTVLGDLGLVAGPQPSDPTQRRAILTAIDVDLLLALAAAHPDAFGSLDGAPAPVRDLANRIRLDHHLEALDRQAAALHERLVDAFDATQIPVLDPEFGALLGVPFHQLTPRQLREIADRADVTGVGIGTTGDPVDTAALRDHLADAAALRRWRDEPGLTILDLDPANGRIVVAQGDVDTADRITTIVPGASSSLRNLQRIYGPWLDEAQAGTASRTDEQIATVLWLGYDAPPLPAPHAASSRYADAAAPDLVDFQAGLRRDGVVTTVVGHSYGGVVLATAGKDLPIDVAVMLAAPGTTRVLPHLRPFGRDVLMISASHPTDLIEVVADNPLIHGSHPHLAADHVVDLGDPTHPPSRVTDNHMSYLEEDSPSREQLADLLAGQPFDVVTRFPWQPRQASAP